MSSYELKTEAAESSAAAHEEGWFRRARSGAASLMRQSPSAAIGATSLALIVLACFIVPVLLGRDGEVTDLLNTFTPPVWEQGGSWATPLGTDNLGRDVLSRILTGGRISIVVALASVTMALIVGVILGTMAGFYGGRVDSLIMRVGDLFLAYPFMLLTISVIALLGPSLTNLIIILALADWVTYARTVRGSVLSARNREYVRAAEVIGVRNSTIIMRHVLPNVLAPVLVLATVRAANYIIWESGLSFLGMGVPPPTPTWGIMLAEGRNYILNAWWLVTLPGLAIMFTILSINLLGDGLRDAMDPRLKRVGK